MRPRVSVIVLNWNGKSLLKACLSSVLAQSYSQYELILVDNASVDGSVDFVKRLFPNVTLIENKQNIGFAGGNNVGIAAAKGEFVFILNNDTVLDKDCLARLLGAAEGRPEVGMVSPRILLLDGRVDTLGLILHKNGISEDIKTLEGHQQLLCPCGGAAFYRKKMLDDIKLGNDYFDSDYFIYYEDLDLGLRAKSRRWKCAHAKDAIVHHHHGATMGESEKSIVLGIRNRLWTIQKNFPRPVFFKYGFLIVGYQVGIFFKYLFKGKGRLLVQSYREFFRKRFFMAEKRQRIAKRRLISDREFRNLLA